MATRSRPRTHETDPLPDERFDDITDSDLEAFMVEQSLREELAREDVKGDSLWNLQTLSGLGLIGVGTLYLLQQIGLIPLGINLAVLVATLPWLAGILIVLTGFGVLSFSPRRRISRARARAAKLRAQGVRERAQTARSRDRTPTFEKARNSVHESLAKRRLTKSRHNKKVAGVCGGLGEYLGVDPTIVRILLVIGVLFSSGAAIALYILLAFVLPKPPEPASKLEELEERIRVLR